MIKVGKEKGITLIALVLAIIILLLLAAITVNLTSRVIESSKIAAEKHKLQSDLEKIEMSIADRRFRELIDNRKITLEELAEYLVQDKAITEDWIISSNEALDDSIDDDDETRELYLVGNVSKNKPNGTYLEVLSYENKFTFYIDSDFNVRYDEPASITGEGEEEDDEYLFDEPGKYKFTINAGEEAQWISLVKIGEYIPAGGSIEYKFQTSNDRKIWSEEKTKIEDMARSQYARVLVTITANNQGESPKIKGIFMKFLTDHTMRLISKNDEEQILYFEGGVYSENLEIHVPVDVKEQGETNTVDMIIGQVTELPAGVTATPELSYSLDGTTWTQTPDPAVKYNYVKVQPNVTADPGITISFGMASTPTRSSYVETAQKIPEWETVDEMYFYADATTTAGEWVSIEPEQYLPSEKTRISYQFSTSNDFSSWSGETAEVTGSGTTPTIPITLTNSQFLKVKANIQVLKVPKERPKKLARVEDMLINYKVNDENYTDHMTESSDTQIYKITYMPNGASGENIYSIFTDKSSALHLKPNPYNRSNYTFLGWCSDSSGDGDWLMPGEEFQVTSQDYTLYAIWAINGQPVTLSGQGSILSSVKKMNINNKYYTATVGDVSYSFHTYVYSGNQTWNENMEFGAEDDCGSSTTEASSMVVVKVNGDLTIGEGVEISPVHTNYGGPKGFLVYCTGTLTNNGKISNNYGAKATGENVYLWKNSNNSYEYVPADGANGGAAQVWNTLYGRQTGSGRNGSNANVTSTVSGSNVKRTTAGGGSGGYDAGGSGNGYGKPINYGAGARGTAYSGGAGGGGIGISAGNTGRSSRRTCKWFYSR